MKFSTLNSELQNQATKKSPENSPKCSSDFEPKLQPIHSPPRDSIQNISVNIPITPNDNLATKTPPSPEIAHPCLTYWLMIMVSSVAFSQGYNFTIYNPIGISWLEMEQGVTDKNEISQILGNINFFASLGGGFGSFPIGGY